MNISPVNANSFKALIVRGRNGEPDKVYNNRGELPNAQVDSVTGIPLCKVAHVVYDTETGKESIIYPSFHFNKIMAQNPELLYSVPGYYATNMRQVDGFTSNDIEKAKAQLDIIE